MDLRKKSLGIQLVGLAVCISNVILFISYYYVLLTNQTPAPARFISFISMVAVFPLDFFHVYFGEFWQAHFCWMLMMVLCSFGILLLNQFARKIFIILNIIHGVVLGYIVFMMHYGGAAFLDYFFTLYFNLVAVGTYVGFLTIREVREQFKMSLEGIKFKLWSDNRRLEKAAVKDAAGYYNLGVAYNRLERYSDAIGAFKKAIAINPNDENFHFHLGLGYLKQRKYADGVNALKEVVRLNPIHAQAYYHMGLAYQQEGCHGEAIAFFTRVSHVDENNPDIYKNLGVSHMAVGHLEEALAAFEKAMKLNVKDDFSAYQSGKIFIQQERFKEALEPLRRAVTLRPEFEDAHFQLGCVYVKLKRYKDALRSFKEVLRRDEKNKEAHYQLGFSYAMLEDFESAKREYRILRDLDTDLAENLLLLVK